MAVLLHAAFNFALMIPFGAQTGALPLLFVPAIACVTAGMVLTLFGSIHLSRNNVRVSV